jgi:hypothetical protein
MASRSLLLSNLQYWSLAKFLSYLWVAFDVDFVSVACGVTSIDVSRFGDSQRKLWRAHGTPQSCPQLVTEDNEFFLGLSLGDVSSIVPIENQARKFAVQMTNGVAVVVAEQPESASLA